MRYWFRGLIFGGAYFRNFTVFFSVFISMERSLFHEFSQQCSDTCTICCYFVLAKGEKEPFDFNSSSYVYFSVALTNFFLFIFKAGLQVDISISIRKQRNTRTSLRKGYLYYECSITQSGQQENLGHDHTGLVFYNFSSLLL